MRLFLNETCTQALTQPNNRSRLATLPTLTYHTHDSRPINYSTHDSQGHNVHLLLVLEALSINIYTSEFG